MIRYSFTTLLLCFCTACLNGQQLSENGKWLLSYEQQKTTYNLVLIDLESNSKRTLTHHAWFDYNPKWSADGESVLFYRKHPDKKEAGLYSLLLKSGKEQALTEGAAYVGDPSQSMFDKAIAFNSDETGDYNVYVMAADGSGKRQITRHDSSDFSPDWSPDGRELVFVSNRTGHFELFKVLAGGGEPTQLTFSDADNYKPAWSPDGKHIAFFSNREGNFEIYVMRADGSGTKRITRNEVMDDTPSWFADSKRIIFYQGEALIIYDLSKERTTKKINIE